MRRATLLPLGLLLAACEDTRPPRWVDVCVDSRTTFVPIVHSMNNVTWVQMMPTQRCHRYEKRCVVGKDFKGKNRSCE